MHFCENIYIFCILLTLCVLANIVRRGDYGQKLAILRLHDVAFPMLKSRFILITVGKCCFEIKLGQKPQIIQKFTFWISHFSQNSHFQSLIFHKIHNFKASISTKFTIFQASNCKEFLDKKLVFDNF